jgi:hypothetical protein
VDQDLGLMEDKSKTSIFKVSFLDHGKCIVVEYDPYAGRKLWALTIPQEGTNAPHPPKKQRLCNLDLIIN